MRLLKQVLLNYLSSVSRRIRRSRNLVETEPRLRRSAQLGTNSRPLGPNRANNLTMQNPPIDPAPPSLETLPPELLLEILRFDARFPTCTFCALSAAPCLPPPPNPLLIAPLISSRRCRTRTCSGPSSRSSATKSRRVSRSRFSRSSRFLWDACYEEYLFRILRGSVWSSFFARAGLGKLDECFAAGSPAASACLGF